MAYSHENFTLTLFSDVDCEKFTNTGTDFTNSLPFQLDFTDLKFEIGLEEIGFESIPRPKNTEEKSEKNVVKVAVKKSVNEMPIGPQNITVWEKTSAVFTFEYAQRKTLSGFISTINQEISKITQGRLDLQFEETVITETSSRFGVTFKPSYPSWIEITDEFSQLIGLKTLKIVEGKVVGDVVDDSIYNKLGKPGEAVFNVAHFVERKLTTEATTKVGFESFLNAWEGALSKLEFAVFPLIHEYSEELVILEVIFQIEGEKMQLSSTMNSLMNLDPNYVFDHTILLSFPQSNFIPAPPVPPTPKPIHFDPEKFIYILCNLVEPQIVGGSLIPALKVLPKNKDKTVVQQQFDPVSFLTPIRQVANSVTIKIVDRDLQPLPASETPVTSSCVLKFKPAT